MEQEERQRGKMTLIVFSGEMDKAMAAFNLAIGAASMNMEVTMFFTFWGLNILKKNEGPVKAVGFLKKMLNIMNRGGNKRLPLSRFNMGGLGKVLMTRMMREARFPQVQELMEMAKGMGVRFVACTTSLGIMGLPKEALIPEVDAYAGVASYLAEAREGQINLFI